VLKDLKRTAKHTIIYSIGGLSNKLIGFILLPLYTTYLSTSEYGILAILEVTSQFMVAFFGFKLSIGMMRWCSDLATEKSQRPIVFTTLLSVISILILFNIMFLPFAGQFALLFFDDLIYTDYFVILFLSISFEILNQIPLSLLRLREKSVFYIILASFKLITILILNIYFIVYLNLGVKGIILSQLIGQVVLQVIALPLTLKNIKWEFKWHIFREMFNYSFPLIFTSISGIFLTIGDRYIIKYFLPYSQVGIYSLGYKLASVINVFLIHSFQMGFLPIAFKMCDKEEAKNYFAKLLTYFVFILTAAALVLSFFAKEIIQIMSTNREYWTAYTVVPLISLAFVFRGMHQILSIGLHCVKKTIYNAYIVVGAAVLHFVLNIILIPIYDIYGAAAATIISASLMSYLYYYYSQKFYYVNYEITRMIKIITAGLFLYCITLFTIQLNVYINMIIKVALLFLYPFILYFINFYQQSELNQIKKSIKKIIRI